LASLAGRAPLGGPRETALASLQIARLVRDALDPGFDVAARAARAVTTRSWLAAIALPRPLRPVLVRVVDASAADGAHAAAELRGALPLLATYLDEAARAELAHLAGADL